MSYIDLSTYQEYVKKERNRFFETPYNLVYHSFVNLGYDQKEPSYFISNASDIVEALRSECWNRFLPREKEFTSSMLSYLVNENDYLGMTPQESIISFAETYPDHIYQLSLSNTQSRRARAGKEFEAIIELILMGAGVSMDTQGNIGKKIFVDKGLGKLVDVVSPGVTEYIIDKNDVVLISAKTTLRERWQEVPEEMGRTGAKEMFLATLDESISDEVLNTLYESNIRITTTRNIKNKCYPNNKRVLDFERLLEICVKNYEQWTNYDYSLFERDQMEKAVILQIEKHIGHDFVVEQLRNRLKKYKRNND
ncbi:MAG: hypothetical protein IJ869_07955 [Clostridiales bacterium]|nr:hypothetical protein [Clostridiales bacterium]